MTKIKILRVEFIFLVMILMPIKGCTQEIEDRSVYDYQKAFIGEKNSRVLDINPFFNFKDAKKVAEYLNKPILFFFASINSSNRLEDKLISKLNSKDVNSVVLSSYVVCILFVDDRVKIDGDSLTLGEINVKIANQLANTAITPFFLIADSQANSKCGIYFYLSKENEEKKHFIDFLNEHKECR